MSAAMQETFTGPQARLAEVEAERDRWAARVKELERRASVAVTALEGGPVYPKAARDIITKEQVAKLAANGCMIVASGEWVAREATPGEALAAWQSKAADLEVENAKLRAEVKRLRGEVELEYDDEPKPVDLDDAYKAIAKVIHQRNEAREENERVARDNERLRTDLASAEEALRQVDAELTALAEENEKLRAELRCDRPPFEYGLALDEIVALLEERDRLRGALERLMLSRDASWTGGHDWEEALDEAAAALAGEGEVGNE